MEIKRETFEFSRNGRMQEKKYHFIVLRDTKHIICRFFLKIKKFSSKRYESENYESIYFWDKNC